MKQTLLIFLVLSNLYAQAQMEYVFQSSGSISKMVRLGEDSYVGIGGNGCNSNVIYFFNDKNRLYLETYETSLRHPSISDIISLNQDSFLISTVDFLAEDLPRVEEIFISLYDKYGQKKGKSFSIKNGSYTSTRPSLFNSTNGSVYFAFEKEIYQITIQDTGVHGKLIYTAEQKISQIIAIHDNLWVYTHLNDCYAISSKNSERKISKINSNSYLKSNDEKSCFFLSINSQKQTLNQYFFDNDSVFSFLVPNSIQGIKDFDLRNVNIVLCGVNAFNKASVLHLKSNGNSFEVIQQAEIEVENTDFSRILVEDTKTILLGSYDLKNTFVKIISNFYFEPIPSADLSIQIDSFIITSVKTSYNPFTKDSLYAFTGKVDYTVTNVGQLKCDSFYVYSSYIGPNLCNDEFHRKKIKASLSPGEKIKASAYLHESSIQTSKNAMITFYVSAPDNLLDRNTKNNKIDALKRLVKLDEQFSNESINAHFLDQEIKIISDIDLMNFQYSILDYTSKLIQTGQLHSNSISIEKQLPSGVYFLILKNYENRIQRVRLLKSN